MTVVAIVLAVALIVISIVAIGVSIRYRDLARLNDMLVDRAEDMALEEHQRGYDEGVADTMARITKRYPRPTEQRA